MHVNFTQEHFAKPVYVEDFIGDCHGQSRGESPISAELLSELESDSSQVAETTK